MDLLIQTNDLEMDERAQGHIAKKVNRLDRRFKGIKSALVEISATNSRRKEGRFAAQVTLSINGSSLRAEEKASNVMEAVSSAVEALDRRVERLKYKVYRSGKSTKVAQRQAPRELTVVDTVPEEDLQEEDSAIGSAAGVVRVKRFPIKPMTVDEAAFEMELLGHDFFLFLNSEDQQYNLIYKRRAGDYGLIQPELL